MKREDYNLRLLKFANHLKKVELSHEAEIMTEFLECDFENEIFRCDIEINMIYLRELPRVFPNEWVNVGFYSDIFGPILKNHDKLGVTNGMGKFFNLKCESLRHMFDILGAQKITRWGGVTLNEKSIGKDFAQNIFDYLDKQKRN